MAKSASPHPASKWLVRAMLIGALAIEFAAVVIASRQGAEHVPFVAPISADSPVGNDTPFSFDSPAASDAPPGSDSLVVSDPLATAVAEPPPLREPAPLIAPSPPPPPVAEYSFQLKEAPSPTQQPSATPRPIVKNSLVRPATTDVIGSGSAGFGFTRSPRPQYPYAARRQRAAGTGKFLLAFNPAGEVIDVQVAKTTGNAVLDSAAIATLRQWKCNPGTYSKVYVPVTFSP